MAHDDVLMGSGGFDPIVSTGLFPSLSDHDQDFPFVPDIGSDKVPEKVDR